jgi:transposase
MIEEAFKMTVTVAKNAGMVKLKHMAIYGTKIKANASSTNLINQEEIQTIRELLKKRHRADEEDKIYGDKEVKKYHLNFYQKLKSEIMFEI